VAWAPLVDSRNRAPRRSARIIPAGGDRGNGGAEDGSAALHRCLVHPKTAVNIAIDHVVFGARQLAGGIAALEQALHVRAVPGGRHPAWGTHNALLGLDPACYVEVLAPDPEAEAPATALAGREVPDSPRLLSWAARTGDLEAAVARAGARGMDLGSIHAGSRARPDGSLLSWRLTDIQAPRWDGIVPFLIDWGSSEHPSVTLPRAGELVSLRAEHPDPLRVRAALEALGVTMLVERGPQARLRALVRTPHGTVTLA
jgi:glyoxalase-like protein